MRPADFGGPEGAMRLMDEDEEAEDDEDKEKEMLMIKKLRSSFKLD